MTTYRCSSCDRITPEDICPDCGVPAELVNGEPPVPAADEAPITEVGIDIAGSELDARVEPPPPPALPEPAAESAVPSSPIPQAGQQQLEEYVRDGYEVFLIAGIGAAGKTQLLDAYRHDAFLAGTIVKRRGHVLPTSLTLDCYPVSVGRRKVVFVDTSGESFNRIYPHLAHTGRISEAEIDFLRLIGRNLSGLVLLVDLARLWNPAPTNPEEEEQVNILAWILVLLRWLRYGGKYEGRKIRFQDYVNRETMRLKKRLKVPVLTLFSRADELTGLPIPRRPSPSRLERDEAPLRDLYPAGEDSLLLAYHCVPALYQALSTHADHFRFDFVHSLVTDRDSGEVIDTTPCGVSSSVAWLLDGAWRWPAIPTRVWLAAQRFVDGKILRNRRWQRLPEPVDVG